MAELSLRLSWRGALTLLFTTWLLAACAVQGPPRPSAAPSRADTADKVDKTDTPAAADAANGVAKVAARSASPWPHSLKPLVRQPPIPSEAPRSRVPAVNYDINSPSLSDLSPDDGLPGEEGEVFQRGGASWYGFQFHNRKTANGERFDMGAFTAAHKTLPFGTRVCVRSLLSGHEVLVRINDRGPYAAGRVIDLSRAAAEAIDMLEQGIKRVALTVIDEDGGRCAGTEVDSGADTDALMRALDDDDAALEAAPLRTPANKKRPSSKKPSEKLGGTATTKTQSR